MKGYYKIRVCVIVNIANEGSVYSSGMDTISYKVVCELDCCVHKYLTPCAREWLEDYQEGLSLREFKVLGVN